MQQLSPKAPQPTNLANAVTFLNELYERSTYSGPYVLGRTLGAAACEHLKTIEVVGYDSLNWNPSFTAPRWSSAELEERREIMQAQGLTVEEIGPALVIQWDDVLQKAGLPKEPPQREIPLTKFVAHNRLPNMTAGEQYNWLLTNDGILWPTLGMKPVNNRKRRPQWAWDDWKIAEETLGRAALIARMEWVHNMNAPEIAEALEMKEDAVRKAITRTGNDVSRFGLRSLDKNCLPRREFAWKCFREENPDLSWETIARRKANQWFGEQGVTRYVVSIYYWQHNMNASEIAEKLEISEGAVEQIIYRLNAKRRKE